MSPSISQLPPNISQEFVDALNTLSGKRVNVRVKQPRVAEGPQDPGYFFVNYEGIVQKPAVQLHHRWFDLDSGDADHFPA